MLALEGKVLQPMVAAVGHYDDRSRLPCVDPDSMRTIELAGRAALSAPGSDVLRLGVVVMNPAQSIAVGDVNVAIRSYGDISRFVLLFTLVCAAFFRIAEHPQALAINRRLPNQLPLGIAQI